MKIANAPARRVAWLLLAAPALLAVPAVAQDAPTAPPPVRATLPQADAPAPTAPAPTAETGSRTTIAPGAADVVDEARIEAARSARAARPAPARQATRAVARPAPAAAPPVQTPPVTLAPPTPAPAAETPAVVTPTPEAVPAADAPTETAATTTIEDGGTPLWPIALIAALIVGAGAFFLLRRRRDDEEAYVEEAYYEAEPDNVEPVAQPVHVASAAAAPLMAVSAFERGDAGSPTSDVAAFAEEPTVTEAPQEDVAALTVGAAPMRDRPWLEFAMRPIRAGTSADEALVEIELTVANSGGVAATDVRVSTFMLTDAHANEMERMMVDAPADAGIEAIDIAAGEGTRIDATLAALKSDLGSQGAFNPVVIAEARYRLPDGSEGRTSASFVVGVSDADGGAMAPLDLADRVMREDVEAQLYGEVEHA